MEDISRELEREIAQAKPKPFKKNRETRILIVDNLGRMRSGNYLRKLVIGLSVVSCVCCIAAVGLFFLYTTLLQTSGKEKARLEVVEKKLDETIREKEVLMARLVILGEDPETRLDPAEDEDNAVAKAPEIKTPVEEPPVKMAEVPEETIDQKPETQAQAEIEDDPAPEAVETDSEEKKVSIEKFTVVKDGPNGDLLVRFDIRNVSTSPGDVSGRIFTVLKPDSQKEDQWLVVPASSLDNGIPAEHRKGQYFSIAHFKPVKFRIKNQGAPDFFKKASIFIFSNQGHLMFEKLIDITEDRIN